MIAVSACITALYAVVARIFGARVSRARRRPLPVAYAIRDRKLDIGPALQRGRR